MKKAVWIFCAAGVTSLVALPFLFLVPTQPKGIILTNTTAAAIGWQQNRIPVTNDIVFDLPKTPRAPYSFWSDVPIRINAEGVELIRVGMDSLSVTGLTIGTFSSNRWQWADGIVLGVVTNFVFTNGIRMDWKPNVVTNRVLRFTLPNGDTKEVAF